MVLTESDRYLIRALREEKKMSLNQILREFPGRHWKKSTVADFLKRLKATGSIERRPGSGRRRKVNCPEKVKIVQKLIRSKDNATGKNFSVRKIALLSGVSRSMVSKIACNDLGIKPVKKKISVQTRLKQKAVKEKRMELCNNLLRRFSDGEAVKKVWFSGEKRFTLEKPDHIKIDVGGEKSKGKSSSKSRKSKSKTAAEKDDVSDWDENDDQENGNDSKNDLDNNYENSSTNVQMLKINEENLSEVIPMTNSDIKATSTGIVPMTVHPNSSNGDLSSSNNDVMNLINNYVTNPLNFGSSTTTNYLSEQNSNYGVPHPSNTYVPPHQQGYIMNPNQSGYPGASSYGYSSSNPVTPLVTQASIYGPISNPADIETSSADTSAQPATQTSNSVIVSIAVSIGGKTDPIFIECTSGNISSECYRRDVLSRVIPSIKAKVGDFVFIQDRSPAHRSQNTIRYLQENCSDFIKPEEWPANCPQLNPVDYYVWKKLQRMVYHGEGVKNVEELKDKIVKCWSKIGQKCIDAAISQWINKINAVISKAKG